MLRDASGTHRPRYSSRSYASSMMNLRIWRRNSRSNRRHSALMNTWCGYPLSKSRMWSNVDIALSSSYPNLTCRSITSDIILQLIFSKTMPKTIQTKQLLTTRHKRLNCRQLFTKDLSRCLNRWLMNGHSSKLSKMSCSAKSRVNSLSP